MAYPGGFTYALGKSDDFPEPLRTKYASIHKALTWLPGDETRGTAETTLAAVTDEEASSLAQRLVSLYTRAEDIRGGSL